MTTYSSRAPTRVVVVWKKCALNANCFVRDLHRAALLLMAVCRQRRATTEFDIWGRRSRLTHSMPSSCTLPPKLFCTHSAFNYHFSVVVVPKFFLVLLHVMVKWRQGLGGTSYSSFSSWSEQTCHCRRDHRLDSEESQQSYLGCPKKKS